VPVGLVEIQSAVVLDRSPVFGLSIASDPAQLSADFDRASARGDSPGMLAALDTMKRSCAGLNPSQIVAGAEAAIALGQIDRARYLLEPYLAKADPRDPTRPAAESLLRGLSLGEPIRDSGGPTRDFAEASRNVDDLIGRCRHPAAPSVPNGRFAERSALQSVERAVLQFRQSSEVYLNCVRQVLERTELDDNETTALTDRYNDMVIELTAVSIRFNQAVANFRSAQPGNLNLD
jgi:hypothetical protein